MRNRKMFQACMAGVLSTAMLMTNVSVWGAEFSDGAQVQEIEAEVQEFEAATETEEEVPVLEDENFTSEAAEASETSISSSTFPDAVFREYVLKEFDTDGNKKLSDSEKKAATVLKLANMGIKDLKGVNYLPYLTTLSVPGNKLKKIDLRYNTRLENINVSGNDLSGTLDLDRCTRMKTINYSDNALTKVDMPSSKYLKKVEIINASKNKFTSQTNAGLYYKNINSSVMPELIEIYASDNAITSFNCNGYAGMMLDLRNNKITKFEGGSGGFQALGILLDGKYNTLKSTSKVDFSTLGNVVPQRFNCNSSARSKITMVTPKLSISLASDWSQIKVTVGSTSDNASYKLEKRTGNGSYKTIETWEEGELVDPEFGENEYIDRDIKAGETYTYKLTTTVRVQDADKNPVAWSKSAGKQIKVALNKPSISVKSSKKGYATISWKEVSGADGYQVYYGKKAGSKSATTRLTTTSKLSYSKSRLSSGKTYYFRVRAYKKVNGKNIYGAPCTVKGVKIK
ncbi:MAG: leucine-rich repeat domain-containing protein [Blautia sp.]|nr:leucine-rich repeat domain-containing protein [Blautia sp.]